jgi:glucose/arabinose dehydrogenase/plastocyanin
LKDNYLPIVVIKIMHLFQLIFFSIIFFIGLFGSAYAQEPIQEIVEISQNSYNPGCELIDSCFNPTIVHIDRGDSIQWVNYDDALHNIVSGTPGDGPSDIFTSPLLKTGELFEFNFELDNSVQSYFCTIHPWMIGYVVIGNIEFEKPILEKIIDKPIIFDNFKFEKFISGLSTPISITFLDDTLLILQKNDGKILSFKDGELNTVLDLEVSNYGEQGLLGITNVDSTVYIFLTEAFHDGGLAIGNKIYKFEWNGEFLTDKKLLKELPADEVTYNGGAMVSDNSGTVFAVTGEDYKAGVLQNYLPEDSFRHFSQGTRSDEDIKRGLKDTIKDSISCINVSFKYYTTNPSGWGSTETQENKFESNPLNIIQNIGECVERFFFNEFSFGHWKDTGVILQIDPPGSYAAIGIRNSFGLAVDPITGYLWDTENGADKFDEINLINKKFNSGWAKIQGPSDVVINPPPGYEEYLYDDPKFSWELPIGITALDFADSSMFQKYENWLFVADSNNGNIYKFQLNENRTDFVFESKFLQDKVVNLLQNEDFIENESMEEILFASNFGLISDIEFGPDGSLYVVSLLDGTIYRIYS